MNELTNHDLKNIDGYCALAAAIVRQVCKDYVAVEKKLLNGDADGDITMDMLLQQRVLEDEMCSKFFWHSRWAPTPRCISSLAARPQERDGTCRTHQRKTPALKD